MTTIAGSAEQVRHDVRLVPAAVVTWFAGLTGLLGTWWLAAVCGAVAVIAGCGLLRLGRRRRAAAGMGAALALVGLMLIAPFTHRLAASVDDPLRAEAARGADAVLRVRITDRARPVRSGSPPGEDHVVIRAEVYQAWVAGVPVESTGRVLLVAPAQGWAELLSGQEVTAAGRLAPARPGQLTVAVLHASGERGDDSGPSAVTSPPWWQRMAAVMRDGLTDVSGVLSPDAAGLLSGLVLGDTSAMPRRVEVEFRDSGMAHLVAVSGLHVGIVCGAVLLAARGCRFGPRTAVMIAAMALLGYVVLVGYRPSVLRAAVMGAVGLLALALGRNRSALPALCVAVIGLVLYDPELAVSFGFAMSVVATGALVLLVPRWAGILQSAGVPPGFAQAFAVPVVAFLATAPIIAGMAGRVSLVSVFANVLAAPVVAIAIVLGVIAAATAAFAPWLAELVVRLAGPELSWLLFVAGRSAAVPGAVIGWPDGWSGGLLAGAVIAAVVLAARLRRLRVLVGAVLAGALLVFVPVRVVGPGWPPDGWAVVACDVGQGDGLVLATGVPGRAVVVDTGAELSSADRCLDRLGVNRIPLIVLTHLHADHIGGLSSILAGRSVGSVAVGPGKFPDWAWQEVVDVTAEHDVPLVELTPGQRMQWPALNMRVIAPRYVPADPGPEPGGTAINDASVVMVATTPVGRVLLTGDVELAAQSDLLASGEDLRADVLKVPHHGSRYALPEFLAATEARVAVISVGADNRYGHPNPGTIDVLRASGALVIRTDVDGETALVADDDGPVVVRRDG